MNLSFFPCLIKSLWGIVMLVLLFSPFLSSTGKAVSLSAIIPSSHTDKRINKNRHHALTFVPIFWQNSLRSNPHNWNKIAGTISCFFIPLFSEITQQHGQNWLLCWAKESTKLLLCSTKNCIKFFPNTNGQSQEKGKEM